MPKRDINQLAASIVARTTSSQTKTRPAKNPAAIALGRLGGLKGGKARADALSKRERHEIAVRAAKARWRKSR